MNRFYRKCIMLLLASLGGLTLANSAAQSQEVKGRTYVVTMTNMSFGGLPAEAQVGDIIIWNNNDSVQHSATDRDGRFDYRLQPGQKARTILREAGTFRIDCIYHPTMRGSMQVVARGS